MPTTRSGRSTAARQRRRAPKAADAESRAEPEPARAELAPANAEADVAEGAADDVQKLFINEIGRHSVVHHWNHLSTYRLSTMAADCEVGTWPSSSDLCCWHCTEPFEGQPVGIPIECRSDGVILCEGNFCSYGCALAHIFHSRASHREYNAKQLLCQVAREMHGMAAVMPAPPALLLSKFGGPLSIEEFRGTTEHHSVVPNPPFARADVVYESTRTAGDGGGTGPGTGAGGGEARGEATGGDWADSRLRGMRIPERPLSTSQFLADSGPLGPALMDDFVRERQGGARAEGFGGGLGAFIRRSKT